MVTFKQVLSSSYDNMPTHCTQIEMQFLNGITQFIDFFNYLEKYTDFINLPQINTIKYNFFLLQ